MTRRGGLIVAVAVGALLLGRAQLSDTPTAQTLPPQEPGIADTTVVRHEPSSPPSPRAKRRQPRRTAQPRQEPAAPVSPSPAAAPRIQRPASGESRRSVWRVVNVVDGDTVDVQRGNAHERVRVIGIDTPERGECGYGEASRALSRIVLGSAVELSAGAVDDRDRYDRLLRYVDVGGKDAGLALLEAGHAIARYDSRDGYGAHPRERTYVKADAAVSSAVCREDRPAPVAKVPPPASGEAFGNCSEARAAGAAPVRRGEPGYGSHLDRDGDGVGCE